MEPNKSSVEAAPGSCSGERPGRDESCPLCGKDNKCRVAKGHLYKGLCWCDQIIMPGHILKRLAAEWVEPACLCRSCLEIVAVVARTLDDPDTALAEIYRVTRPAGSILAEDYYLSDDGKMVFTAAYHMKRGSCCGNDCRHCPY
jgi:hypothetical protein